MDSNLLVLAIVAAATSAAVCVDLRTRCVPNTLTGATAATALVLAASDAGSIDLPAASAGTALGLMLMLPGWWLGATGGGDVKLFAAVGGLIGPSLVVPAFLHVAIAGGLLALAVAVARGRLRRTIYAAAAIVTTGGGSIASAGERARDARFVYSPAIAIGCTLAATRWWQ
jgi:prepilin peptidase CpaA